MGSWESWFSFLVRVGMSCSVGTRCRGELVRSDPCGRGPEAGRGKGHWVFASATTRRLIANFNPAEVQLWGHQQPKLCTVGTSQSHN